MVSKLFPRCGAESHALDSTEHTCLKNTCIALGVFTGVKWAEWLTASCFKGKGISRRAFPMKRGTELLQDLMHAEGIDLTALGESYRFCQKERQSRVSFLDFPYWFDVWILYLCLGAFLFVWVCVNNCNYRSIKLESIEVLYWYFYCCLNQKMHVCVIFSTAQLSVKSRYVTVMTFLLSVMK